MNRLHKPGALCALALIALTLSLSLSGVGTDSDARHGESATEPSDEPTVASFAPAIPADVILPSGDPHGSTRPLTASYEPAESEELPYDAKTHRNGYCEGNCWEGDCPFFDGYPEPLYTERELIMVAKTVWGEARGCSPEEQQLVVWTIFQQVDAGGDFARYDTIEKILTKPKNFAGWNEGNPIDPDIYTLVCEEAAKWSSGEEPPTLEPYAPSLPYLFFDGDGTHNWFRAEWRP